MLWFAGKWVERVELLNRADQIAVIGRIDKVTRDSVGLDPCELVPEG